MATWSSRWTPPGAVVRSVSNDPGEPGVVVGASTAPSLPPRRNVEPGVDCMGDPGTPGVFVSVAAVAPMLALRNVDCSLSTLTTKRACGSAGFSDRLVKFSTTVRAAVLG